MAVESHPDQIMDTCLSVRLDQDQLLATPATVALSWWAPRSEYASAAEAGAQECQSASHVRNSSLLREGRHHVDTKCNFILIVSLFIISAGATCPSLKAPTNGGIRFSNGRNVGSTARHFCQSGFILKGNQNRVCSTNGVWTGSAPVCKRKLLLLLLSSLLFTLCLFTLAASCPRLSIPRYGWIKFTNGVNIGSTATYSCLNGFLLNGDKTRVCQSNGVWTGEDPVCKSKSRK